MVLVMHWGTKLEVEYLSDSHISRRRILQRKFQGFDIFKRLSSSSDMIKRHFNVFSSMFIQI